MVRAEQGQAPSAKHNAVGASVLRAIFGYRPDIVLEFPGSGSDDFGKARRGE